MQTFLYDQEFKRDLRGQSHPFGEIVVLETITQPGMVAADIGGNKGLTTVALAKRVGPSGWVYAFEPVPEYFQALQGNLVRNEVSNVTTYQMALGKEAGEIEFCKDGGGSGIVFHDGCGRISVQCAALDWMVANEELRRPDILSMDCEGSELLALQGAREALESRVAKIFCEIHRGRLEARGQSLSDVVQYLESFEFEVIPVWVDDLGRGATYDDCTHILAVRRDAGPGAGAEMDAIRAALARRI